MKKRNYSYFIIKPDGIKYINEILADFEAEFQTIRYYSVEDFAGLIKRLYYKHYETKGESFAHSFEAYLYGLREIFGNRALLGLVAESRGSYQSLVEKLYTKKMQVREQYENKNLGIVTNYGEGEKSFIRFVKQDGSQEEPRILREIGNHRISNLNILHCPDSNVQVTRDELQILLASGIIQDKNLLTPSMIAQIREYKTFNFYGDKRKEAYIGNIGPDISGFVSDEIERY